MVVCFYYCRVVVFITAGWFVFITAGWLFLLLPADEVALALKGIGAGGGSGGGAVDWFSHAVAAACERR